MAWDAGQYLRFADERTRPCRDLAARVFVADPRRVVDLGCGPGNGTEVLAQRWPAAAITGIDNSSEMLKAAAEAHPDWSWQFADIAGWAEPPGDTYDVVFSNAALQWLPDHDLVLPKLLARVASGGALALQIPAFDSPAHRLLRTLAASEEWRHRFPDAVHGDWHSHEMPFYYDVLAPHAAQLDLWITEYQHIMESPADIVEWYKGTGLRPYLAVLAEPKERERFLAQYLSGLAEAYPSQADGRMIFPFRRLFLIAYR